MAAELLLSKLEKVRKTGPDTWTARCPAHDDKGPSLSIREVEVLGEVEDKVLVRCFAGCSAHEIVAAVGLDLSDLFPPRKNHGHPEKRPFPTADALRAIAFESLVVVAAAKRIISGEPLTDADYERLLTAVERINSGLSATGVMRGTPWAT